MTDGQQQSNAIDWSATPWVVHDENRPLCDVPWMGTSVVLSNGVVNFCCHSSAIAGNVNEATFDQIWQGPKMQFIRSELSEGRLPPECRTPSCPIYRGDDFNYLQARMRGIPRAVADGREWLSECELELRDGTVRFRLRNRGEPTKIDVFVGVGAPDELLFVPTMAPVATPCEAYELVEKDADRTLEYELPDGTANGSVFGALVSSGQNPNLANSVLWARRV